jgi:hypothetical protein
MILKALALGTGDEYKRILAANLIRRGKCLCWTGMSIQDGYGQIHTLHSTVLAHRLAWIVERGAIGDHVVMHLCDNPSCCDVSHLRLGSHRENADDRTRKGRGRSYVIPRHEKAGLRKMRANGYSARYLAGKFGCTESAIVKLTKGIVPVGQHRRG